MIKKLLLMGLFFSCLGLLNAQNSYITQTTDTLQKQLKIAVSKSDYLLAADLKSELSFRQEETAKIKNLETSLAQKVKEEDFANAAKLDEELKKLKADLKRKNELRDLIKTSLLKPDYSAAAYYKNELLLFYKTSSNSKPVKNNVTEVAKEEPQEPAKQPAKEKVNPFQNLILKPTTKLIPSGSANAVPFEAFYYNYVYSDLILGFKYFKGNFLYTGAYGYNDWADFILRANFGGRFDNGIYVEGGMLSYTVDSKFDNSGDYYYAFDWEVGYANKMNGLAYLIGLHVVQLSSAQLSLGIGF